MICKLEERHRVVLTEFLAQDPYYALFFQGNLLAMGFGHPNLEYWGSFDGSELTAVLMRYVNNFSILAHEEGMDLQGLILIANEFDEIRALTGRPWIMEQFVSGLTRHPMSNLHHDYFCALSAEAFQPGSVESVRRTTVEDAEEVGVLYAQGEFKHFTADVYRRRLLDSHCRSFAVVDEQGRIVSMAMTTAETPDAAMIGSVYTPSESRGRGYASRAMSALCADLLADGKKPCLFYDNPSAGVIYRRLGFQDIGMFNMAEK
ncbi:GNAT family N-acetyltransferase [Tumebacillus sp. ITR2]|uniref:GNAT family N-acetyltransferase n=1 Tax=Tumebacillus amylolyticus TaxID=2801339 RepID=A0ABS1JEZ3_9BACL|nr:GNAT family N-acetyltransferase [Tumebacillus amylolyticus]MBL0388790.1 GNAT family N-acetyltransferase [Tumebacillus amylolyticus]